MELKPKPVRLSRTQISDLMFPMDANNQGNVFGGSILKLVDKAAAVCAHRHAGSPCVTVAMDRVEFKVPIQVGNFVTLEAQVNYAGKTSLEIGVEVYAEDLAKSERKHTNSCLVTMVAVGPDKKPAKVPPLKPETPEEKRRFEEAKKRYESRLSKK